MSPKSFTPCASPALKVVLEAMPHVTPFRIAARRPICARGHDDRGCEHENRRRVAPICAGCGTTESIDLKKRAVGLRIRQHPDPHDIQETINHQLSSPSPRCIPPGRAVILYWISRGETVWSRDKSISNLRSNPRPNLKELEPKS